MIYGNFMLGWLEYIVVAVIHPIQKYCVPAAQERRTLQ